MLINNGKKKKHPTIAIMAGALAIYGAYSAVKGMKNLVLGCASTAMEKMKNMKSKMKMKSSSACNMNMEQNQDYSDGECGCGQ